MLLYIGLHRSHRRAGGPEALWVFSEGCEDGGELYGGAGVKFEVQVCQAGNF